MRTRLSWLAGLLLLPLAAWAGEPVTLHAADGVAVYGTLTHAGGDGNAVLLLFHQAAASRHEYDPLISTFNGLGYDTLAIDQRAGGELFGGHNRTVQVLGHSADYLRAMPDLEAALAWAKARSYGTIVIVGSSYSASLAIMLAARHPHDIDAVASFSPGEYFDTDRDMVKKAAARVAVPCYITTDPNEAANVDEVLRDAHGTHVERYRQAAGVHGASTLVAARSPQGHESNLRSFTGFLERIIGASAGTTAR